jgi:hypothetical protein
MQSNEDEPWLHCGRWSARAREGRRPALSRKDGHQMNHGAGGDMRKMSIEPGGSGAPGEAR